jgi:hypothetical protein
VAGALELVARTRYEAMLKDVGSISVWTRTYSATNDRAIRRCASIHFRSPSPSVAREALSGNP